MKKLLAVLCLSVVSPFAMAQDTLHLFNWNDYIDQAVVTQFEKSCSCKVVQDYYSSTDELMAKLQAGASGYDVVVPTQNAVEALIKQKKLSALDKTALPNLKNIGAGYLSRNYDPKNTYSIPYAFTTTLIGYNEEKLKELGLAADSWALIFDPKVLAKIKGKVTVLDESEELFGAALKYLGYSVNDRKKEHLDEAKKLIMAAKPYWAAFNSSSYIKELSVGNIWVVHGYSSDVVQARNDAKAAKRNFTIGLKIPKEGAVLALDNMVVPESAKNKKLAHQFINFMMDGKNAAGLSNEVGAGNPNEAAAPNINAEVKALNAVFPDKATLGRLETLAATSAKDRRLVSRYWTEIKIK